MILELPDVPIRKILLNLSLADFNSVQSVFTSTNNIYLKQLGFQTSVRWSPDSGRPTVHRFERIHVDDFVIPESCQRLFTAQ